MLTKYYDVDGDGILVDKIANELTPSTSNEALLLLYTMMIADTDHIVFEGYIKELKEGVYDIDREEAIRLCRSMNHYDEALSLADSWGLIKMQVIM